MPRTTNRDADLVAVIRRIARAVEQHSRALVQQCGVTGTQLAVLREMDRHSHIAPSMLAKQLDLSQATMTAIVQKLSEGELVARVRNGSDRRSYFLALTNQGRRLLAQAPPLLDEHFQCSFVQLPEWQQTQMLATLQHFAALLKSNTGRPAAAPGAPQMQESQAPAERTRQDAPFLES